jgi:hypothetical protein
VTDSTHPATRTDTRPRPLRRSASVITGFCAVALVLASCGTPSATIDTSPAPAGVPPGQGLTGTAGTWASLVMGHLSDPLNTFGELFTLAGCTTSGCTTGRWALATPPGVASNGGIMITGNPDGGLTAGFGISLDLRFSPLAETTDGGSVWAPGILPAALVAAPDSLAASGPARRLALVSTGAGEVLASGPDLDTWRLLVREPAVAASTSGTGCRLGPLTGVAITSSGDDLVAGTCTGGGRAGIFRVGVAGRVTPVDAVGPRLPPSAGSVVRVVRLVVTTGGVVALLSAGSGRGANLYLATSVDDAATWTVSAPFATDGRPVRSAGVTRDGGFAVLLGAAVRSAAVCAPGAPWRTLPAPPSAAVVAARPDGGLDALVPAGAKLEVDALGTDAWSRSQVVDVPIEFGSTSAGGGAPN